MKIVCELKRGSAFRSGVNVLDSNPDIYKHENKRFKKSKKSTKSKKKLISHLSGGNTASYINLGLGAVTTLGSFISSKKQLKQLKLQADAKIDANYSDLVQALTDRYNLLADLRFNQLRMLWNQGLSDEQPSTIVSQHENAQLLGNALANLNNWRDRMKMLNKLEYDLLLNEQTTNMFSNLANTGMLFLLNRKFNNSPAVSTPTYTPSTNWTPSWAMQ